MTPSDSVADAVAELRRGCGEPADPGRRGPVPLHRFFQESMLRHAALPSLTRAVVAARVGRPALALGDPDEPLAGFVFVAGRGGLAFVRAEDILPRRRFTAAHELGHFVLHRERMEGGFHGDTEKTVLEADPGDAAMEREANRFAAELLLPAEVCAARAGELRRQHGCCPRTVLVGLLASELLVSLEATRYRLKHLGLGDE
jgi:hypothetical protein